MDLSIIIVSWNVKEKLRENLRAIFEAPLASFAGKEGSPDNEPPGKAGNNILFEVFVVDNDSRDGTAEMVKGEFPQAKLIANSENLGFGKANNQAIRQAQGRYVLCLNPDMRIMPGALSGMVGWMEANPKASAAGCRLVNENGGIVKHVRRFPGLLNQLAIVLKLPHLFPKILNRYLMDDFDYAKAQKVDTIRGAFFMFRNPSGFAREIAKRAVGQGGGGRFTIPYFDERYFLWFEEVDYCRQIRAMGGEVWYSPAGECIDYVGQSFKQVERGAAQNYFKQSMLKYFRKWQPRWQYLILKIAWPAGGIMIRAADKLKFESKAKT